MANKEHLNILKQGVRVWNRWRKDNPNVQPDLRGADLRDANLYGVDLYGADLRGADLRDAILQNADLFGADLQGAKLQGAYLLGADLRGADLQNADLNFKSLDGADLRNANLDGADLGRAYLRDANLDGADLRDAVLRDADLRDADLRDAVLRDADLRDANLRDANLRDAILCDADLGGADLRNANLGRTNLSKTTITGVCLYNTARDDWIIDGIKCDYVFWDTKPTFDYNTEKETKRLREQWEREHRVPKDRDFKPGEFEELYKQLPTFEYYFEQGFGVLDTVVMDRIVQAINEKHPEFDLKLKNFETTGTPHATFTVTHQEHKEEAEKQLTTDYESRIAALEGQQEQLTKMFALMVGNPQLPAAHISAQLEQIKTREEAQTLYTIQSQKIAKLRQAYIIETDTAHKFKLEQQITQNEADLTKIEQRLEALEKPEKHP